MLFDARVVENRPLGRGGFILRLAGCQALAAAKPGQFVMLRGEWGPTTSRDPLLPRAFSILRTLPGGECELLVKAMGRGTRLLELIDEGASVSVLGPLGRPFPSPAPDQILVAGGVGLAPLLWHAELARDAGIATVMCYGARSSADLVLLERIPSELHVTTEDGSHAAGLHGRVTLAVEKTATPGSTVLTCGPNPMMKAVVEIARARGLACYVSVEGEMACGIGACLGCALPTVNGARPFEYACVDGPVFDAAHVVIP